MKRFLRLALLGSVLVVAASAQTLLHQWRFGENDAGAANGGSVTTAKDNVGTLDLTTSGTVTYTSSAVGAPSTLAATFGTGGSFVGAEDSGLTPGSSFIVEGWFYLNGTPPATTNLLYYNGNPSNNGIGLYVTGTALQAMEGGRSDVNAGTLNANQWNYVALVYSNGNYRTYVNSDSVASYSGSGSFNDYFGGGGGLGTYIGPGFAGSVDELRVSTFTGSFNTSMLSYNTISAVPEPSTYAALAGLAALGLVAWRRRQARA